MKRLLITFSWTWILVPCFARMEPTDKSFSFTANAGQVKDMQGNARPDVLFTAEAGGMKVFFLQDRICYVMTETRNGTENKTGKEDEIIRGHRVDFIPFPQSPASRILVKAEGRREITSQHRVENVRVVSEKETYYLPHCPQGVSAETWGKVRYTDVSSGISIVFYPLNGRLKYDWEIPAHASLSDFTFGFEGAEDVRIDGAGGLEILHSLGKLHDEPPVAWEAGDRGKKVEVKWKSGGHESRRFLFRAETGDHNPGSAIIIDPAVSWSTYYGGTGVENDKFYSDVMTDSQGNLLYVGHSASMDFPVSNGAFQTVSGGGSNDAVIVKFNSAGARLWATYFGGSGYDLGNGIAIDGQDNICFTGSTSSNNLPVTAGAFQSTLSGGQDMILAKFTASGMRVWATYYGGTAIDEGYRITRDSQGNLYVCGATEGQGFPVTNGAFQATHSGFFDGFLVKFTDAGARVWATFMGGAAYDYTTGITLTPAGEPVVAGYTNSTDFPVSPSAWQSTHGGGGNDAFLGKFSASGNRLWMTFMGGSQGDDATCVDTDAFGNIYFAGRTFSNDFPVSPGAFQTTYTALSNSAFVSRFSPSGNREWATYLGGNQLDRVNDIEVNVQNQILVTGETRSTNFPVTTNAIYPTFQGGLYDVFIAKFNANGTLPFATFYGSAGSEFPRGIGSQSNGDFFLVGYTQSTTHPVTGGAFQSSFGGGTGDAFVTWFDDCPYLNPGLNQGDTAYICGGGSLMLTAQNSWSSYAWNTGATSASISANTQGWYVVTVGDGSGCTSSDSVYVTALSVPTAAITPSAPLTFCDNVPQPLTANAGMSVYSWYRNGVLIPGATQSVYQPVQSGNYTVKVQNLGGCSDSLATAVAVTVLPAPVVNLGQDAVLCSGDSLTLDAGAGHAQYAWCNSTTSQTLVVNSAGNYCVQVTEANGCTDLDTILVSVSPIQSAFTFVMPTSTQANFTDQSTGGAVAWSWNFGDGSSPSTQQNPAHTFLVSNTVVEVCLTVTDTSGCADVQCDSIGLGSLSSSTLPEFNGAVFPNPFRNEITVRTGEQERILGVVIRDLQGRIIMHDMEEISPREWSLRLGTQAASVFFMEIRTTDGVSVKKVVQAQ